MSQFPKPGFYNAAAIVCGLWFLLTGSVWAYFANLVIAFPVGLLGMYLWGRGRLADKNNLWNKVALVILVLGFVVSFAVLAFLLFKN